MPAIACRDVDTICDWFLREDNIGRLMVTAWAHAEEQHTMFVEGIIKDALAGLELPPGQRKQVLSDFAERWLEDVRP